MSDSSPGSVLCPQRSRNVLPGLLWLLTETMRHIRSSRADAKKSCPVGTSQWPPVCGGSSGWTSSAGCGGGRRPCDPSCEQLYHGPFWICSTACQLIGSLPQAVSVHRTRCVYRGSGQALARGHVDQAQNCPLPQYEHEPAPPVPFSSAIRRGLSPETGLCASRPRSISRNLPRPLSTLACMASLSPPARFLAGMVIPTRSARRCRVSNRAVRDSGTTSS